MPNITANDISLYYEEVGDPSAPVILLIMGLGTQMIAWPEAFQHDLAAAGYRVIAFDNRDIGLSTHLDGAATPNFLWTAFAARFGLPVKTAYSLTDMAADAVALLDALHIPSAHIVGASMGGMIAQIIAATAPDRVLSLTSIMSTSGAPGLPGPAPGLRRRLLASSKQPDPIAAGAEILEMTSHPDPARGPDPFRAMAQRAYDRASNPQGRNRQLLAIIADGSRASRLAAITAPTLVIHGANDPLIPIACGKDTAARIKNARLEVIEAMAHDLPPSQMAHLARMITDHAGATAVSAPH